MDRFPICKILCSMLVGLGVLRFFFSLFLCPWPWAQPQCMPVNQFQLLPLSLWSGLHNEGCTPVLHCYCVQWGHEECGAMCSFCFSPSPYHLITTVYSDMSTFRCLCTISLVFMCWAGNPLLNSSCPICFNFKRRLGGQSYYAAMLLTHHLALFVSHFLYYCILFSFSSFLVAKYLNYFLTFFDIFYSYFVCGYHIIYIEHPKI